MKKFVIEDILSSRVRRETICILEFLIPGIITNIEGFGSERIKERILKTIPLIEGRLKKLKPEIDLTNYTFLQNATKQNH